MKCAVYQRSNSCLLILLFLGTSILPANASGPAGQSSKTDAAVPADAGADIASLDVDGLRVLAEDLLKRVKELEQRVPPIPVDQSRLESLEQKNERLTARIEELNKENDDLRARLNIALRADRENAQEAAPEAEQVDAKFRYEYEWYLVGHSSEGRMVIRSRDEGKDIVRYNYEEYLDDRIGVDIFFRNDLKVPASFSVVVVAEGKITGFLKKKREVLAKTTYRTPVIQPGEVHEFSKILMVDDPEKVDLIELMHVKSTTQ